VVTSRYTRGVAIAGSYAYVAAGESGLQVIDITNPTSPQLVGSVDTPGGASGVAIENLRAYVADDGAGLQVIDLTDPTNPQLLGGVATPSYAKGVAVAKPCVYLATYDAGLAISWQQCEASVAIEDDPEEANPDEEVPSVGLRLAVHPNPFNPQTTVTFALEQPQHAEVAVYDLTGMLLGILANRSYDAGNHSVVWNGEDAAGRAVPSGTYVVRLETESCVEARKISLIR